MPTHSSDQAACAALLRQGSRSFAAASVLLPRPVRVHATALYGFCRLADDLIDDSDPADRRQAIAALRTRLELIYAGRPQGAADREFAGTVAACGIPRALPEALLEGFAWDAEGRCYDDISALRGYGARVAGSVGTMMALAMGVCDPHGLARAAELGVAMQLSNIARDVGEDARAGRIYLPRDWLTAAGIDAADFLRTPTFTPALGSVVARLLAEAETLYASAEAGIEALPVRCRPAIRAALRLYRGIGRAVARQGGNSVDRRAVMPRSRKLGAVAGSVFAATSGQTDGPALPETEFLLRAIPRRAAEFRPNPIIWVLELFARLEQQDQYRRSG